MQVNMYSVMIRWLRMDFGGKQTQLWPFLAAVTLAFAWLQPHHYYPWPGFHTNAWVAVWMAMAAVLVLCTGIKPQSLSLVGMTALALMGGIWIQYAFGLISHPADALMSSMYMLSAALLALLVRAIHEKYGLEPIGDVIFGALVISGIATVFGAMYQVLQIKAVDQLQGLGIWIMTIPDGVRPAGNVAQPNQMATLLNWAIVGALWLMNRKLIGAGVFCLLGCYLAIGLGVSQSRVGVLELLMVVAACGILRGHLAGWTAVLALQPVLLVLATVFFGLPWIHDMLLLDYQGRALEQLAYNMDRLGIYRHVLAAIGQSPWYGYGMTTLVETQWINSGVLQGLHAYYFQSHNFFLDLLAWWGMPIGGLLMGLIVWWCWRVIRRLSSAQEWIFAMALLVVGIHALVELPHWNAAYFLLAVIFVAVLDGSTKQPGVVKVGFKTFAFMLMAAILVLCTMLIDYLRIENDFVQVRAEALKISQVQDAPRAIALTHLSDYLHMNRMIARPNVPPETIAWMERTVRGIPNYNTQVTHAITLALNGRQDEARIWMQRLNSVSPRAYHQDYLRVWGNFQRWYPHLIGQMQWPALDPLPPAAP